jgi:predicted ATP-grasp superfamily ATP-dependent carboligase
MNPIRTARRQDGVDQVPAIVCGGGNPAGVTIVQSLGPHGMPIHVLSNLRHPATRYSKYTTTTHLTPLGLGGTRTSNNIAEPDELLDYLVDHVPRGVLFPGSDSNTRFLARHRQRLIDEGFGLCIPDLPTLETALAKSELADFCEAQGFPLPKTVHVHSTDDLDEVRSSLDFPVILKGSHTKNHRLVRTPDDLAREYATFFQRFERIGTATTGAVAQEWIPGDADQFVKLYVMCDQDSRVMAWHTLRRLRVQVRADGSQGDTLVARTERVDAVAEQWLPLFEALGWVGMASLETKYDPRDGTYKIIEINPRPWAILKVTVDCGVDVPMLYYRAAQGERVEPSSDFEEDRHFIRLLWGYLDHPEPLAVLSMLLHRHIGLREVLSVYGQLWRARRRVSIDVGRLRDPLPTLAGLWFFGLRHPGRWLPQGSLRATLRRSQTKAPTSAGSAPGSTRRSEELVDSEPRRR